MWGCALECTGSIIRVAASGRELPSAPRLGKAVPKNLSPSCINAVLFDQHKTKVHPHGVSMQCTFDTVSLLRLTREGHVPAKTCQPLHRQQPGWMPPFDRDCVSIETPPGWRALSQCRIPEVSSPLARYSAESTPVRFLSGRLRHEEPDLWREMRCEHGGNAAPPIFLGRSDHRPH